MDERGVASSCHPSPHEMGQDRLLEVARVNYTFSLHWNMSRDQPFTKRITALLRLNISLTNVSFYRSFWKEKRKVRWQRKLFRDAHYTKSKIGDWVAPSEFKRLLSPTCVFSNQSLFYLYILPSNFLIELPRIKVMLLPLDIVKQEFHKSTVGY